jgi:hypothetical protein
MSRGLGHIERIIQKTILDAQIDRYSQGQKIPVMMNSWHVVGAAFRPPILDWSVWTPNRSQELAVNRAMHSFVRKFPQFALMGGQGRKRLILYDTTDRESVAWATANMHSKDFVPLLAVKKSV